MAEGDEIESAMRRAEAHAGERQDSGAGTLADPQDPRALRAALGLFATGVTVVTTREAAAPHHPIGITANSFASVSLAPPLVLWSAARASMRHIHFATAQAFAIHVLAADQRDLALRFARNAGDFAGLDPSFNAHDVPLLPGALARFECLTAATHEGGDHTIIIGEVVRCATRPQAEPLLFARGGFGRLAAE